MKEIRKAKLLANIRKSGIGGTTFRATLPSAWVREMGLSEDIRDLQICFNGKEIIIRNEKELESMKLVFKYPHMAHNYFELTLEGKLLEKKLYSNRREPIWKHQGGLSSAIGSKDVEVYKEIWEVIKKDGNTLELEVDRIVSKYDNGEKTEELKEDYFADNIVYKDWGIEQLKEFGDINIVNE